MTSRPSLGTGASLRTLTLPGPPGRERAADETLKVQGGLPDPSSRRCPPPPLCAPLSAALGQIPQQLLPKVSHAEHPASSLSLMATSGPGGFFPGDDHLPIHDSSIGEEREKGSNHHLFKMCEVLYRRKSHRTISALKKLVFVKLTLAGCGRAFAQPSSPCL